MEFNFYYEMSDSVNYDEVKGEIRRMEIKEFEYFKKTGEVLDKRKIPAGTRCNDAIKCCPYCVCDCCLLYGGRMISTQGVNGFSFQNRKKQCIKDYPKGKYVLQLEVDDENIREY